MNQRLQLPLKGIQRNKPDGLSEDGTLQEIINIRPKDGAWHVVGGKTTLKTYASGLRYHFLHKISPTRQAWWVTNSTGKAVGYYMENGSGTAISDDLTFDTYSGTQDEVSFASLGNVVVMIDTDGEVLQSYLFESDTDTYRLVGDLLPDLIGARITGSSAGNTPSQLISAPADREDMDAVIMTTIAEQRELGYWVNRMYFRYAYELFDGSIVKHSQPIRIDGGTFDDWEVVSTSLYTKMNLMQADFQITSSAMITTLQTDYKGLVKSVNIYACLPNEDVVTDETSDEYLTSDAPVTITHTDPKIDDITNFYLVKKIAIEELTTSSVDIFDEMDLSDLVTNNEMPVDNMTAHTYYSDNPFQYNQRLFWSGIKNTLFSGFDPDMSNPYADATATANTIRLYFEITIETNQGTKVVLSDTYNQLYNYDGHKGYLACFAYPDSRASKLKIIVYDATAGTYSYKSEHALIPHTHFNFAFIEDAEFDDDSTATLPTEVKTYWDYNRIQATELMNPFYFPSLNSYRVGNGSIVGCSTNAIAISTGQYGQYPVYVFATDGIWTLQVGDGDTLIESIKPLSRHVCNNIKSIQSIDGGCTFSTEKGLFVISGEKPVEISKEAEGKYTSVISSNTDYTGLMTTYGHISDYLCDVIFITYLSGAVIGYDCINNEIMMCNTTYSYSWVFNIDSGVWYKVGTGVYDYFINDFPVMLGVNLTDLTVIDITLEPTDQTPLNHQILIETRPISFGITGLKKITRALMEMYMNPPTDGSFTVQLYGSADGITYSLVYQDEDSTDPLQRLLIGRTNYSCEYYILVIIADAGVSSYITQTIVDVKSKFSSKLRKDM